MNIDILRGKDILGGAIVSIEHKSTKIIIDFGKPLNDEKEIEIDGITIGKSNVDAVFLTHYHGDHLAEIHNINKDIDIYMGEAALNISKIFYERIKNEEISKKLENAKIVYKNKDIIIGDLIITPILVDHSAYESFMYLVSTLDKTYKVLHTGDFRIPDNEEFFYNKFSNLGQVDELICEGTSIGKKYQEKCSEYKFKNDLKESFRSHKYNFIYVASTNIARQKLIADLVPKGMYFIGDEFQQKMMEYIAMYEGTQKYKLLNYGHNLKDKIDERGFVYLLKQNETSIKLLSKYKDKCNIIYSMWPGYLEGNEKLLKLLNGKQKIIHRSGHATEDEIVDFINFIKPKVGYYIIHTENDIKNFTTRTNHKCLN